MPQFELALTVVRFAWGCCSYAQPHQWKRTEVSDANCSCSVQKFLFVGGMIETFYNKTDYSETKLDYGFNVYFNNQKFRITYIYKLTCVKIQSLNLMAS